MDAPVDRVQIVDALLHIDLAGKAEHHIRQIRADRFQTVGQIGERPLHMDGAQVLHGACDQIRGPQCVRIAVDRRGVQRAQRAAHALGYLRGVLDAAAAGLEVLVLPRLRIDPIDALDRFA